VTIASTDVEGLVFDIDSMAVHDGPGIRMSVYLKGCPLRCAWCHSPESQGPKPELAFAADRCTSCAICLALCAHDVHRFDKQGLHTLQRDDCIACGICADGCISGALSIKGEWMLAELIVHKASRLKTFFDGSGGGVTLTGGEVTMQPEFAEAVLAGCRQTGIHTAIETCGATTWERMVQVADQADLVLYDIKLYDEQAHRQWTGVSNESILDNAARLAQRRHGQGIQVRVPLIPGITDTETNLLDTFAFVQRAGLPSVAILPYNASASAKYEWLGRTYGIQAETQTQEALDAMCQLARQFDLDIVVD